MRSARGFTLIEMLVIITIGSLLAGFAVVLLHGVLVAQKTAQQSQEHSTVFRRLADDFRRDVHAASESEVGAAALTLRGFAPPTGARRVRYEVHDHEILRVEDGENGAARRESYFLPKNHSATFRENAEPSARVIELVLTLPEKPSPKSWSASNVEAVLGSDRRYEKVEKNQ
ncbi:MAG: type II secretion system protein [Pirellulales bacterium]|nr:type II secretion system protein [Pirellulales bacterium]